MFLFSINAFDIGKLNLSLFHLQKLFIVFILTGKNKSSALVGARTFNWFSKVRLGHFWSDRLFWPLLVRFG
jgi:hypothetical protein